ncbi:MAG: hypothetical protein IPN12_00165 [Rhodocyclaceae bacterium]|nr:hypothetical protein [Rhodocyclaceae bacterium]
MSKRPPLRPAILALLDRDGPMRAAEIAQALNRNQRTVSSMLRYIKQTQPDAVHITRYDRSLVTSGKWGAVWALGPGTDARPPRPLSRAEVNARHEHKWGAVRRARERVRRGRPAHGWLTGLI